MIQSHNYILCTILRFLATLQTHWWGVAEKNLWSPDAAIRQCYKCTRQVDVCEQNWWAPVNTKNRIDRWPELSVQVNNNNKNNQIFPTHKLFLFLELYLQQSQVCLTTGGLSKKLCSTTLKIKLVSQSKWYWFFITYSVFCNFTIYRLSAQLEDPTWMPDDTILSAAANSKVTYTCLNSIGFSTNRFISSRRIEWYIKRLQNVNVKARN